MKEKKDIQVAIRFSKEEFEPLEKIIKKGGWSNAKFLRMIILNQVNVHDYTPKENEKINRLLFYFNKTSNNLNQIAKQLNAAHIEGKLTEKKLMIGLNELIKINENFHYGIKLVTKD